MKKEFNRFYKDKRFLIPVFGILGFEILLQFGIYSPILKKNSYAANVNRITNHTLNKQKILDFVQAHGKIQNNDVEKLAGVSNATAERYLNELEKEGKLTQHGTIGQSVFYTAK